MITVATDIPWQELQHAFGSAHDVPRVLAAISQAHGRQLRSQMEQLWERVLHQGSIYSASPPAVQALIGLAAKATGGDRKLHYEFLAEFARSARQAVRNKSAISCCGGDPAHGRAILGHLLEAHGTFAPDLENQDCVVRRMAADLLCCSRDAESEAAMLVRCRFEVEKDRDTRIALLEALRRVRDRIDNWPGLLAAALDRDTEPALRFALRCEQVRHFQGAANDEMVGELTALFLKECQEGLGADGRRVFEALECLGPERELETLLATMERSSDRDFIREAVERSLRLAFRDERTGWENKSFSPLATHGSEPGGMNRLLSEATLLQGLLKLALMALMWKLFPFLLRRKLRQLSKEKDRRGYQIEYHALTGYKPDTTLPLTAVQHRTLAALAVKAEVWMDQTNLWELFDLPDSADSMIAFLKRRA